MYLMDGVLGGNRDSEEDTTEKYEEKENQVLRPKSDSFILHERLRFEMKWLRQGFQSEIQSRSGHVLVWGD